MRKTYHWREMIKEIGVYEPMNANGNKFVVVGNYFCNKGLGIVQVGKNGDLSYPDATWQNCIFYKLDEKPIVSFELINSGSLQL